MGLGAGRAALLALLVTACQTSVSGPVPPIADAGVGRVVGVGTDVTLDGSASRTADGQGPEALTFAWSIIAQPAGSTAVFDDESLEAPTITIDDFGDFIFRLVVNHAGTDSAPDVVVIRGFRALSVVSQTPPEGAFDTRPDAPVVVMFSEPVQPETVTPQNFYVANGRNVIAGQVQLGEGNLVAVFMPSVPYPAGQRMTAVVTQHVVAVTGTTLPVAHHGRFIVADGPDTRTPAVLSVTPADQSTGVPASTSVTIAFDEALDPTTVTGDANTDGCPDAIQLVDSGGTCVPGTIELTGGDSRIIFTPDAPLMPGATYTLTVVGGPGGLADLSGNALAADYTISFTIDPTPDTAPPTVVSMYPGDRFQDVPLGAEVIVTFSEALDPATADATTFNVENPAGTPVAGTFATSVGNTVVTFTPSALEIDTVYTITLRGDGATVITDAAGNALDGDDDSVAGGDYTSVFRTVAARSFDGTFTIAPTVVPGTTLLVRLSDRDLDITSVADAATIRIIADNGESESNVALTENGATTGVFETMVTTTFGLAPAPDDGVLTVATGDIVTFIYDDAAGQQGVPRQDTWDVTVVGGTDGVLVVDATQSPGQPLTLTVDDVDLDLSTIARDIVTVTVTSSRGEVEVVSLDETGLSTGVFTRTLATILGSGGTDNDGTLSVQSGDTAVTEYIDALNSQGGSGPVTATTNFLGGQDITLNIAPATVAEGDGTLSALGSVSIPGSLATDLVINLSSDDVTELMVPATVTILSGSTSAAFDITVVDDAEIDAVQTATITGSAPGWTDGSDTLDITDNETQTIALSLGPPAADETDGTLTGLGSLTIPGTFPTDVIVALSSNDTTELTVPAMVTIPAGMISVTFDPVVIDDLQVDGQQIVTVTATAAGWTGDMATITIQDNESPSLSVVVPPSATETDGVLVAQGTVSIPGTLGSDLGVFLVSGDTSELTLPVAVIIPTGTTSAVFDLTVIDDGLIDGTQTPTIRAWATGWNDGNTTIDILDDESPTFTLAIASATATEGDGVLTGDGTITIPGTFATDVVITLSSDDVTEMTLPPTVTLTAGMTSVTFDVTVEDDTLVDGTVTVTATASATGWTDGTDTIDILDDEAQALSVVLAPASATEGDGVLTGAGTVSIPGTFASDIVVNLTSSDTSELTVPASVTIVAGMTSATFDITVVDDTLIDGTQLLTVTGAATGWLPGGDMIDILDDEPRVFTLDIVPTTATEGDGTLAGQGSVTIAGTLTMDVVVTLTSDEPTELTAPGTVTILAGSSTATFDITVVDDTEIDGTVTATLTASAATWTPGNDSMDIMDDETQSFALTFSAPTANESDGVLAAFGTVTIPGTLPSNLVVDLTSVDPSEITVPATVTIMAGATSATFDVTVVNDTLIDGTQTADVTASLTGWTSDTASIDVLDDETQSLTVTLPADPTEGDGVLAGAGSVSIPGTLGSDLIVNLASNDSTELTVPASVTILAGMVSASFDLTVVDDAQIDGSQTVDVTASAGGWNPGTDSFDVQDNETQTITLALSPTSATEGDGVLAGQGSVTIPGTLPSDLTINLTSSDTTELSVPATVVIPAGNTSATFDLTVVDDGLVDGTQAVTVDGTATGFVAGSDNIDIDDNESRTLTVTVPLNATEGDGVLTGQGIVSIPGTFATDLGVFLTSSDTSEVTVPAAAIIVAGTTSVTFDITVTDDALVDGTQTATITATATTWTDGTDVIDILDDETQTLAVTITPANATETAGVLSGAASVSIPGTLASDLVVTLGSNDTTELTVPATVTILAGNTSAAFDLTIVDDVQIDGTQTVTVTASATGWSNGTDTIDVLDDETQAIALTLIPATATEGDGVLVGQGTATIPGTLASDLVVTLVSDDLTELTVPASVTITAGSTSASFDLTIIDDTEIDDAQTVTVTGSATGFTDGNDTLDVLDNEARVITLTVPASATEGDGLLSNQGTVSIPGTLPGNLSITLSSDDPGEIFPQSSVVILAGTTSRTFNITVVNDTEIDGTQTATITGTAASFTDGNDSIDILDNETQTITVTITPATSTEGNGVLASQGRVTIPGTLPSDFTVNLSSSDLTELTVPAAVTVTSGSTLALFDLTVVDDTEIDGTVTVTVTGSQTGWTAGNDTIDILDNETQTISVAITPLTATEGDGTLVGQGAASIPGTLGSNLVVTLVSDDLTELTVPGSVTILAGSTTANFDITVVTDTEIDGTQTVTVTGSSTGWTAGNDTIDILDAVSQTISLAIASPSVTENAGVLVGEGTVTIPGTFASNVVVTLGSSDTSEITVPASVTILAGATSATFDVTVPDDIAVDGTQTVTVTGSSAGWASGADNVDVLDDESPTITVSVTPTATEGDGVLVGQGTVSIPGTLGSDLAVFLVSNDTSEATVPAAVNIIAGTTSVSFNITILDDTLIDGTQTVTIDGSAAGWNTGSDTIDVLDNETQTITLAIAAASATEGDGVLVGNGSVTIPGTLGSNLVITLSSSDSTEITVPASVTILAGATSATFNVSVEDDTQVDGTQSATVTGSATGWTPGNDTIDVDDNETRTITLTIGPANATEGDGVLASQGSVSIPGTFASDLTVTLGSGDTTELTVPASVIITAGSTSASFDLTVVDDTQIDGSQTVTVTGSAASWTSGNDTIDILDNETQTIALAIAPLSATEGDGVLAGQGTVTIPGTLPSALVITLASNDLSEVTVPATVTIPIGFTSASFSLTVVDDGEIDDTQTATVTGSRTGWTSGNDSIDILDNETRTFTLAIAPANATEGDGTLVGQGTVTIPGTLGSNLVVNLSSSDTTELTVPATVTVVAGMTSANFNLGVVDDTQIDGTQTATVTASLTGWTPGNDTIDILDDETQTISIAIGPATATEGDGTLAGQGVASIPGTFGSNLVVTLSSDDTTELTVPATVTILAGATSANFDLTVVDDTQIDGTQTATVTGSATGWTPGNDTIDVNDNETQTIFIAIAPTSATEGDGVLAGQGTASIPGTLPGNLVVTLGSSDTSEITVPATVTILAGSTSATFSLTVIDDTAIDGTQTVTVTGSAGGYTPGNDSIDIDDNESQTLTVTVPVSATEGDGVLVGQGTVTIPGTFATDLGVSLFSSDTSEATVPAAVIITAGMTSATFNITIQEDTLIDGTQTVTITGSASGWTSGNDDLDVLDNESQTITLSVTPLTATEGDGTLPGQGTVSIPGTFGSNLVVNLSSGDTSELTVPASVTIIAGSTSANFNLTVVDDTQIDGTQTVTVTGSTTGWTPGNDTIDILDNESQTISLSIAPVSATEGDGTLSGQGSVSIPGTLGSNLVVTLTPGDPSEVTAPATVTILAGATSATFSLFVQDDTEIDGTQTADVTGSATGWTSGADTIDILDNETRTISIAITPPNATEGDGTLVGQGVASIPGTFASNLTVNLSSDDFTELTVPATVTIIAGMTSATFNLQVVDDTQIDDTQTATVTGSAATWTAGNDSIDILDNETRTISIAITPASASEGAGLLAGQATATIPGTLGSNLVVTLGSSDTSELTVPATVTILAGSTSQSFDITAVNDTQFDGTITVTVTGSETGWTPGNDTIDITDDEVQIISLAIAPNSVTEGDGVLGGQGTVSIPGTRATNLVVTLGSSDTGELTVPATATILAGNTAANFDITVVDDGAIDGTQTVTVTGSATGWTSGNDTVDVDDDETQTFSVAVPALATEGDGVLVGQGSVSIPGTLGSNLVVTLGSDDTSEVTVPASVTILAGMTSATFNLTVVDDGEVDGTQTATVTGSRTGWTSGNDTIDIDDNETRTITVAIAPANATEGDGVLIGQGTVSIPGTLGVALVVNLSSSDTSEVTVPATATIPIGMTSATFDLTVIDDTPIDGTQNAVVTGSATTWTSGNDNIDILDNETQDIIVTITPASATEGDGVLAGQGTVSIPGAFGSNLVVTLTSDDTGELTVPATVTIIAGATSATFDLTVVDDGEIDGTQTPTVTGTSTGWTGGADTIDIDDNETQTITLAVTPASATEGDGLLSNQGTVTIPGTLGSNLSITLGSDDSSEITPQATVVILAGTTSRTFNLTVVDDTEIDGTQTATITGSATGWTSGDDTIDIDDNETQTITLSSTPASSTEGAGVLSGQGTVSIPGTFGSDLLVSLASNDTSELTVPVAVVITAGMTSATFNLTVIDDTQIDGTQTVTVTGSATGWTSGNDTIDINDDETQTITVSIIPANATEGDGTLTGQGSVSIPGTLGSDLVITLASNDTGELTVPATATITAGSTSAVFNLTVIDDTAIDGSQTVTVTGSRTGWTSGNDTIDILDDEAQVITLSIIPADATEGDGALTNQGTVSIPGTFGSNLVVTLSSDDTSELTVPATVTIVAGMTSATFTPTVVQDTLIDGAQTVTVTGSATGWTSGNDTINILDDESPTLTVVVPVSATEGDGVLVGQGTVSIPGTLASDLGVTLSSSDTSEATVPAAVVITAGMTSVTFDITVVNDALVDETQTVIITASATGWNNGTDSIDILDDEPKDITLVITPATATEGDGVLSGQGSVSIVGVFATDVVVTLSSGDTSEVTVPATVTITAGMTSATFDVTVQEDTEIDGTVPVIVTGSSAGWGSGNDTISIQDNETRTITLAIAPVTVTEGDGVLTGQGTVSIPGTFASNLVVSLSSDDTSEITVPATATIIAGSTSATFNVTVVDDGAIDGSQMATVTGSAATWTSGNDSVTIDDNETQTITLAITPASATEGAGVLSGQGSVTIPGTFASNVVVTLASSDTSELTVPATVTIIAGMTSATFDLTVPNDGEIDGSHTVTVTGTSTGWTGGNDTIDINDDETQTITVAITPANATEGDGTLTNQGTVTIPGTFASNLVVSLASNDATELTVPPSVTIVAGMTSATFDLTVINDTEIDGTQTATVTGSSTGWVSGNDTIDILDDETRTITLAITPLTATEGDGVLAGQGTVSIPGTFASNLVINLSSDDTTEVTVPATVTILAGNTSANFDLTVVNDGEIDATQTATVTGTAATWTGDNDSIDILDNETQTLTLSLIPASATEGDGVLVNQGTVTIPGTFGSNVVVTLTSNDTGEMTVPATVTILAGNTSANFNLTVIDDNEIDDTQTVTVSGTSTGWVSGNDSIDIDDNETRTITIVLGLASATEGDGLLSGQGTVNIPGTLGSNLTVNLSSSDGTELSVPASVDVLAGMTSATFDLTVVDDGQIDGTQTVTVTGTATGWTSGNDTIDIDDDETQTITLTVPASATEGDGLLSNQGTVTIPGTLPGNLSINLSSDDPGEIFPQSSVVILAGTTSRTFNITVVNDTEIDGTQTATITGSQTGWVSGADSIDILDDETQTITLTVPASATEGDGLLSNQGTVSIPGTLPGNLSINLSSDDPGEIFPQSSVVILAGTTSRTFNITVVNDTEIDGTQTATITGSQTGWVSGADSIDIFDNESQTISVAITPASATEGDGVLAAQGTVSIPGTFASNLTVNLSSDDTTELTVPPSATIVAGMTSVTFDLTVVDDGQIDGTQTVTVTGSSTGWTSGNDTIDIDDDETQTITLNLVPLSATEGDGVLAGQGSVSIPGTLGSNLVITLGSNDTGEMTVPATVTILAGSTSATFDLTVIDDTEIDGTQTVTVTASATGWTGDNDTIDIDDNETMTITVNIVAASLTEGDGFQLNGGQVSIPGTLASNLVVTLSGNDPSELAVPASATILAGSTSANFNVTVIDDTEIDGTQTVTVTASATGWTGDTDDVDILDGETQTITLAITPVSAAETAGVLSAQGSVSIPGTFASNLVINLSSDDTTELTVPATVTIIAGMTSATFDLTAVDDTEIDGTQTATVSGTSTGWVSGNDTIDITDDETQTITLTITPATATEGDGVLAGQGTVSIPGTFGSNLVITLGSNDTGELTVPATVTIIAGSTSATFDLTVIDDGEIDDTQTVTVTGSATGWTGDNDTIDILDNETRTITLTVPASATEGDGLLSNQGMVTIPGTLPGNLSITLSTNDAGEAFPQASVVILAGTTSRTFNLTVVDDTEIDGTQTATITGTAATFTDGNDTIDILDNETQTITIAITPATATEGDGTLVGQGTASIPGTFASNLVVSLSSDDTGELTVPVSATIVAGMTSVTFDLTVIDDTQFDGTQTATVTGSSTGWTSGNDSIDILDNEVQIITVTITPPSATEGDAPLVGQGTVSIPGTLGSNLVVTLSSDDTTELAVPATATILAGSTSVTFDLTVANDTEIDGTQTATVTGSATGWTSGNDSIDILDDESQTLTVTITPASASEGAGALTNQGTITIPGTFASNVVVTLGSNDTSELTVPATATILAGNTSVTFTPTAVDDTAFDGTITVTVTGSATGWTSGNDTIDITDDEVQVITLTITPANATEGDSPLVGQGTVSIPGTLGSNLVVTLSSLDTTEVTVPASATIVAGMTSATFDLTVVDDTEIDGTQTPTVSGSATGWTTGNDTIDILDNETQTITLVITPASAIETDPPIVGGGSVSIPGTLGSNLVITLGSNDTTELTVPATVTILAGFTSATFDLTPMDDALLDGTVTVTVTGSATGWTSGNDTMDIISDE